MSWSPAQQVMLEAMGYTLYARAGSAAAAPAAEPVPAPAPEAARRPPAGRTTTARPAQGGFERLEAALRRAARGRELAHVLPPLAELRASPAAKRAFWPVLRALRRVH